LEVAVRNLPTVVAIGLALFLAGVPAARAEPRRWLYRGNTVTEAGDKAPLELAFVETGRRAVGAYQVVDLTVHLDGKAIDDEQIGHINTAPFTIFARKLGLIIGKDVTAFVLLGDAPLAEASIKEALAHGTKWRAKDAKRKPPRAAHEPQDRPYAYGRKTGDWSSICEAYLHPSPDTGDFYETERCFAPRVGVTVWTFESAWGGFELELVKAPADPAL
jgi:hypothetical protein